MTDTPPLRTTQAIVDVLLKDPLYGPRVRTGIEIGRIVVDDGFASSAGHTAVGAFPDDAKAEG